MLWMLTSTMDSLIGPTRTAILVRRDASSVQSYIYYLFLKSAHEQLQAFLRAHFRYTNSMKNEIRHTTGRNGGTWMHTYKVNSQNAGTTKIRVMHAESYSVQKSRTWQVVMNYFNAGVATAIPWTSIFLCPNYMHLVVLLPMLLVESVAFGKH